MPQPNYLQVCRFLNIYHLKNMEVYHENYAKQLSRLLHVVNDGKEGYKTAAEEVHSTELKELFINKSDERARIAEELKEKIREYGGHDNDEDGDHSGKLHRSFMAFKAAFTAKHKDDQAVLQSVRTGEEAALGAFDDVLQGEILNTNLKPFITGLRLQISEDFYFVDKMYFDRFNSSPELNS